MGLITDSLNILVNMTIKDFLFNIRGGLSTKHVVFSKRNGTIGEVIKSGIRGHGILDILIDKSSSSLGS